MPNNGEQHILSEMGHVSDIVYLNYEAFVKTITSYYNTGKADISLYCHNKVNFKPEMSFPKIANIAVVIFVFLILLICGIVIFIYRKIKKRRKRTI